MIAICNFGIGNCGSIANMLSRLSDKVEVVSNPSLLTRFEKVILPGVGSFDTGMSNICALGWADALGEVVIEKQLPVLGICLGMQLMCKSSEEGDLLGLGWIDAEVKRFRLHQHMGLKVPHMGWNSVSVVKANPLIEVSEATQRYYFVHSFHVVCNHPGDVLAITNHGADITAAFSHGNIYGVQFHPEKSHRFGLALLKRFVDL